MTRMTFSEFKEIIRKELSALYNMSDYLNEAGLARMKAFREVDKILPFCTDFEDLRNSDSFENLTYTKGEHEEYCKVINLITYRLDREVKNKAGVFSRIRVDEVYKDEQED